MGKRENYIGGASNFLSANLQNREIKATDDSLPTAAGPSGSRPKKKKRKKNRATYTSVSLMSY